MSFKGEINLLIVLTVMSFVSAALSIILRPVLMCFYGQNLEEKNIHNEILHHKAEQRKISMQDDFAAHAKLQRKINKLEDNLKDLSQLRLGNRLKCKLIITYGAQAILGLAMFIIALWYRYTPICILEQSLFPFQKVFGYPIDVPNAISPHAWLILSRISFSLFIKSQ